MESIRKFKNKINTCKRTISWLLRQANIRNYIGHIAPNTDLQVPYMIDNPTDVYLFENTKIRSNCKIHNAKGSKVIIKKYTVVSSGCTFVTDGHISTVGIPQFLLGASHINDKRGDIIVDEDVWIGTNCTIMPGVHIGRGAVIGACSLLTKDVPPYSVVAGIPAKIVKKKFEEEDIIKHEASLYPKSERMSLTDINKIFQKYFENVQTFGISKPLSDLEKERLNSIKSNSQFVEPFD